MQLTWVILIKKKKRIYQRNLFNAGHTAMKGDPSTLASYIVCGILGVSSFRGIYDEQATIVNAILVERKHEVCYLIVQDPRGNDR